MTAPLVSVITPLYRAEPFVAELVRCVLAQTFSNFEWICVDDCSPDRSVETLVNAAGDLSDLKVIRLSANRGPGFARNAGLRAATGQYVAFLDADDLWLPDKLRHQVEFMLKSGHRFTFHDYRKVSVDGALVGAVIRGPDIVDWKLLHRRRGIGCLTVMLERSAIPLGLFPDRQELGPSIIHEDFAAWARILADGSRAYRLPLDMARHRLMNTSYSASRLRGARSIWYIYRVRERIPFLRCVLFFLSYLLSAALIRVAARPRYKLAKQAYCT